MFERFKTISHVFMEHKNTFSKLITFLSFYILYLRHTQLIFVSVFACANETIFQYIEKIKIVYFQLADFFGTGPAG